MATIAIYILSSAFKRVASQKEQAEALVAVAQEVDLATFATKADLAALEVRLYKFLFAAMSAQTAFIVGLFAIPLWRVRRLTPTQTKQ